MRKYRCCECGCEWERDDSRKPPCPSCGSVYYVWVNYAEFELGIVPQWTSSNR